MSNAEGRRPKAEYQMLLMPKSKRPFLKFSSFDMENDVELPVVYVGPLRKTFPSIISVRKQASNSSNYQILEIIQKKFR